MFDDCLVLHITAGQVDLQILHPLFFILNKLLYFYAQPPQLQGQSQSMPSIPSDLICYNNIGDYCKWLQMKRNSLKYFPRPFKSSGFVNVVESYYSEIQDLK
jgi:hypothetical protein